jgi:hypothetical protein
MFSSGAESNRGKAIGRSVDNAIRWRKSRSASLVGPTFVVRMAVEVITISGIRPAKSEEG